MKAILPLILASVTLSALAQIALKLGMSSPQVQRAMASGDASAMLFGIGLNPMVLLGLTVYFASAIVWLFVLSKVEVSFAYPFVALGFVFTAILGRIVFGDGFSAAKIGGTLLIIAGVLVLARSA